ncbi:MAG: helix-turn-helix transcriptional regulator, partial [Solirubrobacterales bacterium]
VADLLEAVIESARERADTYERKAVVTELRALVNGSGLTQAEFAGRIGTSASRMSSYVNGGVVPAATLMVRARNAAAPR